MQTPNDTNDGGYTCVGELCHKRWGIEKAVKRPKHRLSLDYVTGLSQPAVVQYVAAKILRDNLRSLVSMSAHTSVRSFEAKEARCKKMTQKNCRNVLTWVDWSKCT